MFGLPTLGKRDATATAPHDMFDYNQQVSPLSGVRASRSAMRAASQRAPSHLVPDDDSVKPLTGIRLPASVMRAASQRAPSHEAPYGYA